MSWRIGSDSSWLGNLALTVLAVVVVAFSVFVFVRDPDLPGNASTRPSARETPSASSAPDGSTDGPTDGPTGGPADGPTDGPTDGSAPIDTVIVIGDDNARFGGTLGRWPDRLAEDHDWTVQNLSRRGTGYAVAAGALACGLPVCPSFRDMIATAAKQESPDLVIVSGGGWDGDLPRAEMRAGVTAFFQDLRAAFPDVQIIALNPLELIEPLPASVGPTKRAVAGAVGAVDGLFVDAKQPDAGETPVTEDGPLVDQANTAILAALDARLDALG